MSRAMARLAVRFCESAICYARDRAVWTCSDCGESGRDGRIDHIPHDDCCELLPLWELLSQEAGEA